MLFKEYINESNDKKTHVGTCVDSFSATTGDRKKNKGSVPYRNVTDFAQATSNDDNENKDEHKISKEEFLKHVHVEPKHKHVLDDPSTEFLHNKKRDSHMMYDAKKDIHHFYEHL